jgi:hypothetical protein
MWPKYHASSFFLDRSNRAGIAVLCFRDLLNGSLLWTEAPHRSLRTCGVSLPYRGNRRDRVVLIPVMDTEDLDIRDSDSRRAGLDRDSEPKSGLPIWPWLVLLGLLAIAAGVVGPLVRG